jgi:pimeloyl-ACP methyl ester carboxylesterase
MAERYLEEIRTVQPTGPYLLAGWSLGGSVAFEMAQRLVRGGERMALLVLIEGFLPPSLAPDYLKWIVMQNVKALNPDLNYDELQLLDFDALNARILEEITRAGIAGFQGAVARLFPCHGNALWSYRPSADSPYPGRIIYFRGANQPPTYPFGEVSEPYGMMYQPLRGFSCCPFEVHEVPGSHYTLALEPNVTILANRLKQCIREAEGQQDTWSTAQADQAVLRAEDQAMAANQRLPD